MQRRKIILWATVGGALVGALAVRLGGSTPASVRNFGFTSTPLGREQLLFAAIPWVVFSLYWEIAAKNTAKTKSSETKSSRGIHVILANVALVLEIIQSPRLGRFLPMSFLIMTGGCAVETLGLFVAVWARRHLGRYWSGEITTKVGHELIRTGPYKMLRHPIYTGLLTMYAGTAVVSGSRLAIVGMVIAIYAYWRKVLLEEVNLRAEFGEDYDVYVHEAWALIPFVY
jgi:protein-S-isoprenylcysteine O-methyltransferase Ste14